MHTARELQKLKEGILTKYNNISKCCKTQTYFERFAHNNGMLKYIILAQQPVCRAASVPNRPACSSLLIPLFCAPRSSPHQATALCGDLADERRYFDGKIRALLCLLPAQTSTGPFWSERGCSDMTAFCKCSHVSPAKHSKHTPKP